MRQFFPGMAGWKPESSEEKESTEESTAEEKNVKKRPAAKATKDHDRKDLDRKKKDTDDEEGTGGEKVAKKPAMSTGLRAWTNS